MGANEYENSTQLNLLVKKQQEIVQFSLAQCKVHIKKLNTYVQCVCIFLYIYSMYFPNTYVCIYKKHEHTYPCQT